MFRQATALLRNNSFIENVCFTSQHVYLILRIVCCSSEFWNSFCMGEGIRILFHIQFEIFIDISMNFFEYEYYNTTFLIWLITEIQYVHQILLLHKTHLENRLLCSSYKEKAMIFRTKAKMKIKFENAVCILYKRFQILIFKLNALLTFQRTDSWKENVTRVMN